MLVVAVVAVAVVGVVAGIVLLALAPRLRLFDDQRRRGIALAVMAVVVLGGPFLANTLVRREATSRQDAAADRLYEALVAADYGDLAGGDPRAALGEAASGVTAWAVRPDGTVEVVQPVRVAWVRWCVVGEKRPDGDARVDRRTEPCP